MSAGALGRPRVGFMALVVVAALADATAVVGLVFAVIAGYNRIDGVVAFAYRGWPFAIAATAGMICTSMVVAEKLERARTIRAVIVGGCIAALVVPLLAVAVGWNLTPNPAIAVSAPLRAELRREGAAELCSADDPGYGPDNLEPWTTTYYRVRGGGDLTTRIAASRPARDLQLRYATGGDPDAVELESLATGEGSVVVTVVVYDGAAHFGDCSPPGYDDGAQIRPGSDHRIVEVRAVGANREP